MKIKICGIKTKENLFCCEDNNVDFFGMIFYTRSPRNISIEQALILQNTSKNMYIKGVGVFVNENLENLKKLIIKLNLNYIQLHGQEDFEYIEKIKKQNLKIIKKISIGSEKDLIGIEKFKNADYFLFDYKPNIDELPGGNAKSFDWNIIKDINISKPWFLSGGISIGNIGIIKSQIKPYAIDLSSSMEKKLGIKDNAIINNFMEKFYNV